MAKIFVTRKVPFWEEVSKPLVDARHEIVLYQNNHAIERSELEAELEKGYDGLLCLLTDKIDGELLDHDKNHQLKIVANYAVGYDNIDVPACAVRNIIVTNTPCDQVNEAVAEFTWALLLGLTRRILEGGEFMRNAAYKGWEPEVFLGSDVRGKTLGLVGMGRIGGMVAKRAAGFGVKVLYYNRRRSEESLEQELGVEFRENLDDLLENSDFVSLHVPLTPETKHLINGKNLPKFKKGSMLINTARGPVVDETEVVEALRAQILGGYGADVFENEPDPHPELLQMENVILTPHIASGTWESRRAMGETAVKNLLAVLSGQEAPNLVK